MNDDFQKEPRPDAILDYLQRLGLEFQQPALFRRALTHRSYLNERPEAMQDNERMEFLGDAVLDFLVGAWLFNRFPEMAEGELTRLRSALVRTEQLAVFADQIDLGSVMRLGRGEADGGGRKRPALLCATFEAVVGAIYLDVGLEGVRRFIEPMLQPAADEILAAHRDQDPKSLLQEWVQSQGLGAPLYRPVSAYGPEHEKTFEMEVVVNGERVGLGSGRSKQAAAKTAAQAALNALGIEP
jgi:ribonuclease-3